MASIQLKGETYYCQFSHGGKRHTVTAGKVSRGKAEAFASGVEDLLEQVRRGGSQSLTACPSPSSS